MSGLRRSTLRAAPPRRPLPLLPGQSRSPPASARTAFVARGVAASSPPPIYVAEPATCANCCRCVRTRSITTCRPRRSSSSAAVCWPVAAACCSLLKIQFSQRLPPGEHRVVELSDLRLPAGKSLREFRPASDRVPAGCARPAPSAGGAFRRAARIGRRQFCRSVAAACSSACCC